MTELPGHIEQFCDMVEVSDAGGAKDAARLRTILEAAQEVAQTDPTLSREVGGTGFLDCGFCAWDRCDPECPHRKLKEAMADA